MSLRLVFAALTVFAPSSQVAVDAFTDLTTIAHASAQITALDRTIMLRTATDGKVYGEDEVDPLLWSDSDYFLGGESRPRLLIALETVSNLPDGDVRRCSPAQRALVQNRVWQVFDHVQARTGSRTQADRDYLQALARTMAKPALDQNEIAAIPDPLESAARSGQWPAEPTARGGPDVFLPADIADAQGPWIYFGREDSELPAGADFALIRRLAVIDRDRRWQATPLTLSIQLRHYHVASREARDAFYAALTDRDDPKGRDRLQSFAEFELETSAVAAGGTGRLRAIEIGGKRFRFVFAHSFDHVDGAGVTWTDFRPGPESTMGCVQCHNGLGLKSVNVLMFSAPTFKLPRLIPRTVTEESGKSASWKMRQVEWGALQAFWPAAEMAVPVH